MDKISVIVPVYNVEKYLDRCVESIVNQTYTNLEIILVDDGSPDNCPNMCDDWAKRDERIKVIHKDNCGPFKARISGIDLAAGDYITFIDSDDWIVNDTIQCLVDMICKNGGSQIASICSEMVVSENVETENNNDDDIEYLDLAGAMKYLNKYSLWSLCGKLYRKDLFNDLDILKNDFYYSEDLLTNYFIFKKAERIAVSQACKYIYFRHNDSIMGEQISKERINGHIKVYKLIAEDMEKDSLAYKYHMANRIKNDLFLVNEIIKRDLDTEWSKILIKDLKECVRYVYIKDNAYCFDTKRKLGVFILLFFPGLYKKLLKSRS